MKYQSCNCLHDFEFHDSIWSFVSYDKNILVIHAKELNVHKDATQTAADCDMEIQLARITFTDWKPISFTPGVTWETDEFGKSYPVETIRSYTAQNAAELFFHELEHGATILHFSHIGNNIWEIGGCGDEPYFEACFSFSSVTIEWDELLSPAWYVRRERGEI